MLTNISIRHRREGEMMTQEELDKKDLIITLWLKRDFSELQNLIGPPSANAIAFITGFFSKEVRDKDMYCKKCFWPIPLCTCKSVGDKNGIMTRTYTKMGVIDQ